jgi:hypothetical protein
MSRPATALIALPALLLLCAPFQAPLAQPRGEQPDPEAQKHYKQGYLEFTKRNYDLAIRELEEAVELDQDYLEAWKQLAAACEPGRGDNQTIRTRALRRIYELAEDGSATKTRAAGALKDLGIDPTRKSREGSVLVYIIPVVIVLVLAAGYYLLMRRREEEEPAPVISLDFGEDREAEDLEEALAAADGGEPAPAAAQAEGDELDAILTRLDEVSPSGPEFENVVMRIGAAALTDAKVVEGVAGKLIPNLKSSDRDRRLKAFRVLINFEGESERIDSALESFDRSGFTDEELGI